MSEGIGGKGGENEGVNAKSEENEGVSDKSEKNVCAGVLNEAFKLDLCMEQLYSPSLIRLWRTGCLDLLHTAEENDDFDVI